jgi:MFS family permease
MLFTFVAACLLEVFLRLGLGAGWFLPCYILLAMSCLGSTVSSALMKESNPPEAVGTSIGIMNGAYYVAVAVATNLVGFIMDRYQSEAVITAKAVVYPPAAYEAIFLCCIGLSVIAVTAACCLRESRGTSIYPGQGATP